MVKRKTGKPQEDVLRPETHETDTLARRAFEAALPAGWVANRLTEDYAKDYHIEIRDPATQKVTGSVFYAQLKGTRSLHVVKRGTQVAFSLELRYSKHYAEEVKLPVFLIVVDVSTGHGYWLLTQEYLKKQKNWKSRSALTYHIPVKNQLSAFAAFHKEIERPIPYMRAYAQSLQESLKQIVADLEATDQRFRVVPLVTLDGTEFRFHAREPVNIQWRVVKQTPDVIEKFNALRDTIDEPITFAAGEIEAIGSPLFNGLYEHGATIQTSYKSEGSSAIVVRDDEGREIVRLGDIRGYWQKKGRDLYFTSEKRMPVSLELGPMKPPQSEGLQRCPSKLKINPTKWEGQPILNASYFKQVDSLFRALVQYKAMTIEFTHEGSEPVMVRGTLVGTALDEALWFLDAMRKARYVADRCKVNPVCKEEYFFDDDALIDVDILHSVLSTGRYDYEFNRRKLTLEMTLPKDELRRQTLDVVPKTHQLLIRLTPDCTFPFLGLDIPVAKLGAEVATKGLGLEMIEARLDVPREEFRKRMESEGDEVIVAFSCSKAGGRAAVRYLTDDE